MKRSLGPRKTASNLSEAIHQKLNMYALAASAAGVGVLALAQPSEAKIKYTNANVVIGFDDHYAIDLNHDGISDLVIRQLCFASTFVHFCDLVAERSQGGGIEEGTRHHTWAAALKAGANIGYTKQFNRVSNVAMAYYHYKPFKRQGGYWNYAQAHYLGVAFLINGKTHFGWARFKNSSQRGATLTGYAYETIAGKSIKAGQKKGAVDDQTNEDFGPSASLTSPIPDTPQPASLGILALGANGVPLWRRRESDYAGMGTPGFAHR
jgi:hypothetical protein